MRNAILALSFVALLSGCSTYNSAYGGRSVSDPRICSGSDGAAICALMVGACVAGAAFALSN